MFQTTLPLVLRVVLEFTDPESPVYNLGRFFTGFLSLHPGTP
jgi:hypothetical protein